MTLQSLRRVVPQLWLKGRNLLIPSVAVSFTVWLIIVPLIALLLFSFRLGTPWQPGSFTLQHYIAAYSSLATYSMFLNTAVLAAVSTCFSVSIAVLFAFLIERTDMPLRNVAWALMLIPIAMPGLLFAISWIFLLSPQIGLFNIWLRQALLLIGFETTEGPLNIYSLGGMIFLETLRGVTTAFLIIVGAFRSMDPSLEEAARVSGASTRSTFFRVFIPLLAPAILAASIYSFMSHLESLEIPIIIGFPAGIYVFPTYIYFTTQRFNPPQYGLSAALGVTFLISSLALVLWYRHVIRRVERFATVSGRGYRPRVIALGRWRYPAFALFLFYFIATIALPTLALIWRSLLRYYVPPSLGAMSRMTLEHYREILLTDKVLSATVNSVVVGVATASLTMLLSLILAWVITRRTFRGKALLDGIAFLPHALPGVIIGIAFIFLYFQPPLRYLQLYGTAWIIILGLTVTYLAFGSRTMNGAMAQIHKELEEAAQVSGAKWESIMRRVVLPLLLPSFVAGWIWVASHSLRAFSIPLMLSTKDYKVLSVIMWTFWDEGHAGQATALGVLLIAALAVSAVVGRVLIARFSQQQQTLNV